MDKCFITNIILFSCGLKQYQIYGK